MSRLSTRRDHGIKSIAREDSAVTVEAYAGLRTPYSGKNKMRIYFSSAGQSFGNTIWAFYAVDFASASLRFRFDHGSGVANFFDA